MTGSGKKRKTPHDNREKLISPAELEKQREPFFAASRIDRRVKEGNDLQWSTAAKRVFDGALLTMLDEMKANAIELAEKRGNQRVPLEDALDAVARCRFALLAR